MGEPSWLSSLLRRTFERMHSPLVNCGHQHWSIAEKSLFVFDACGVHLGDDLQFSSRICDFHTIFIVVPDAFASCLRTILAASFFSRYRRDRSAADRAIDCSIFFDEVSECEWYLSRTSYPLQKGLEMFKLKKKSLNFANEKAKANVHCRLFSRSPDRSPFLSFRHVLSSHQTISSSERHARRIQIN